MATIKKCDRCGYTYDTKTETPQIVYGTDLCDSCNAKLRKFLNGSSEDISKAEDMLSAYRAFRKDIEKALCTCHSATDYNKVIYNCLESMNSVEKI